MTWSPEIRQFITDHLQDDTARLLLSAHRYPTIDMAFAVEQIEARRRLRTKLPEWYAHSDLIMGGRIPAEQCSSEQTACFKRSVMLPDARSLCDMTGGMGVDFWYMSRGLEHAIYTERQPHLCEAARHNFVSLSSAFPSQTQVVVREGLSTELPIPTVDVIYLDPARRAGDGARIYEISDCEPDVVVWQHQLLQHCRQLITKVSPMADITRTLSRLVGVTDVYVVSVRNECKELLILQQPSARSSAPIVIHCVDFLATNTLSFSFAVNDDISSVSLAESVERYFYEPDVSILKAQSYAALSAAFPELGMFDSDCHFFTSDVLRADFPGRIFHVDEILDFSSKSLKRLRNSIPQANIAVRNFPLSADQLRARSGIRDGGEVFLFGATLHKKGAVLLRCHKFAPSRPALT